VSIALAVALLALLVALFALVALVAVYARVRALEAGRGAELSGYARLVGRAAPAALRPRSGERVSVVAVLDADCAICHAVWDVLGSSEVQAAASDVRFVALVDRPAEFAAPAGRAELLTEPDARADLFEGYTPTLLSVDAAGVVTKRSFVYADTDMRGLVLGLTDGQEVSRA
jgi:hypothetical protein